MIKVVYRRKNHRLTITGHANSGEVGHDLVCASASILAYTLAANVENMTKAKKAGNPIISLSEGNANVYCKAKQGYRNVITLVYDSVCVGFELLAKNYPDYLSYEIRD